MARAPFSLEIYQFRIVLHDTSPPLWRRLLVSSDCTLIGFHQILQTVFAWSECRAFSFHLQGHRSQVALRNDPRQVILTDLGLYEKERFVYREEIRDATRQPWQFDIRLEKKLTPKQSERYPRCIGGAGAPAPEDCGGPLALESFRDLFTPDYICHRLAEMLDEGWRQEHVEELQQLRPWMDRTFSRRELNRRLQPTTKDRIERLRP